MRQQVVHERKRRRRLWLEWIVGEVGKSILWLLILQASPERRVVRSRVDSIQTKHPVVFRLWAYNGHSPVACQHDAVCLDTQLILNWMCLVPISCIGKWFKHQEWTNSVNQGVVLMLLLSASSSLPLWWFTLTKFKKVLKATNGVKFNGVEWVNYNVLSTAE